MKVTLKHNRPELTVWKNFRDIPVGTSFTFVRFGDICVVNDIYIKLNNNDHDNAFNFSLGRLARFTFNFDVTYYPVKNVQVTGDVATL